MAEVVSEELYGFSEKGNRWIYFIPLLILALFIGWLVFRDGNVEEVKTTDLVLSPDYIVLDMVTGDLKKVSINVTNNGNKTEELVLDHRFWSSWVSLEKEVFIAPRETKKVTLVFNSNANTTKLFERMRINDVPLQIIVYMGEKLDLRVVGFGTEASARQRENISVVVNIINYEDKDVIIEFGVDGIDRTLTNLDSLTNVSMTAHETKNFTFIATVPEDAEGDYKFNLHVRSAAFQGIVPISIDVTKSYVLFFFTPSEIGGSVNAGESRSISFRNGGTGVAYNVSYALSPELANKVSIEYDEINKMDRGKSYPINILFTENGNLNGTLYIVARDYAGNEVRSPLRIEVQVI